ncbi:MAG: metal-dependent transcriptional regulator [Tissierellia bacterium]|nr:metal-dependent transcriptional regulator [Tissierellia bacterium]
MEIKAERNEYLIAVFKFEEAKKKVTNKALSQSLKLSPSSVTEMVKKLKADGMLKKSRSIELSQEGRAFAKDLISRHRLWEYFLSEILDYSWDKVHHQAQLLQNTTEDTLFEKLNAFLEYPHTCPHGGRIYINDDRSLDYISLADAKPGLTYTIKSFNDDKGLLKYIDQLGLKLNDSFLITSFNDFDKAANIELSKGESLSISPKACGHIYLEKIE